MAEPLNGLKVLDLSRVMSGPYCTSMLADLGAEVIKIEQPNSGDDARHFGPYLDGESTYFMMLNRNKKSVTVNIKSPEGREIIEALAKQSDVLVENFRPGVTKRLGIDYEALAALNPKLIYASISGFGQESPLANWPAFDLVIQAMSGLMSLTGPKGGPATAVGESIADVTTGMFAAFGILAAVIEREKSGRGQHVDISMLDSVFSMQLTGLARQLYFDDTPKPVGNRHPVTYPVDSFSTQTGEIVMVCFSDHAFASLADLMGEPALADDPNFATNTGRNQNETRLRAMIQDWTSGFEADELVQMLVRSGIPAAPIWNLKEVAESNHVKARGLIENGQSTRFGDVPVVGVPLKFSRSECVTRPQIPALGEQCDTVLKEALGYDDAKLKSLRDKDII